MCNYSVRPTTRDAQYPESGVLNSYLYVSIYAVKADPAYSDSYRTSCLYELWPEAALLKSLDYLLLVLRAKGFDSDP